MYLSQILLDPFSRRVQGRHRTIYQTHRSILRGFPDPLPPLERVLFRREDGQADPAEPPVIRLLVQSQTVPDWRAFTLDHQEGLLEEPQIKRYEPPIQTDQRLCFRLLANPTAKRGGQRLGLLNEAEQINWLLRKGEAGGFDVDSDSLRVTKRGFQRDATGEGQALSLLMVQFDGLLQVKSERLFVETLRCGIGSGKGVGCGLLSVAPTY